MKRLILISLALIMTCSACKKKVDEIDFSGTVIGGCDCTGLSLAVSEIDYGWVVNLDTPDSLGSRYYDEDHHQFDNAILLYGTHARLGVGNHVSGRLYLDKDYANSYCSFHPHLEIPEAVCTKLD